MSNSTNKVVAGYVIAPVAKATESTLHPHQRGCVRGRQGGDNLLDAEVKAISFCLQQQSLAGLFSVDVKAAYPSVSRRYIRWVVRKSGMTQKRIVCFPFVVLFVSCCLFVVFCFCAFIVCF